MEELAHLFFFFIGLVSFGIKRSVTRFHSRQSKQSADNVAHPVPRASSSEVLLGWGWRCFSPPPIKRGQVQRVNEDPSHHHHHHPTLCGTTPSTESSPQDKTEALQAHRGRVGPSLVPMLVSLAVLAQLGRTAAARSSPGGKQLPGAPSPLTRASWGRPSTHWGPLYFRVLPYDSPPH